MNEKAIEKFNEFMRGPMEQYQSPRREDEIDLVSVVRERMVQAGLLDKLPHAFDNNRFIQEAVGKPSHAQQYNLNRYFSTQLMVAQDDTLVQRYALIYEIQPDEWLNVFDNTILPAIVNFNLPVEI